MADRQQGERKAPEKGRGRRWLLLALILLAVLAVLGLCLCRYILFPYLERMWTCRFPGSVANIS